MKGDADQPASPFCPFTLMNRWLRRALYGLASLFWLIVMIFPFFAVFLATQGQIQVGATAGRHLRFFLIQEVDRQGIGVEWTRPYQNETPDEPDEAACFQTSVTYLMWEGKGDNVAFCQCQDAAGNALPVTRGRCGGAE